MRDGRMLVGWGMATSTYPTNQRPAQARVRVAADGMVLVQSGTQDLGTGTYTVMSQVAADTLGVPVEQCTVRTWRQHVAAGAGIGRLIHRAERGARGAGRMPGGARQDFRPRARRRAIGLA